MISLIGSMWNFFFSFFWERCGTIKCEGRLYCMLPTTMHNIYMVTLTMISFKRGGPPHGMEGGALNFVFSGQDFYFSLILSHPSIGKRGTDTKTCLRFQLIEIWVRSDSCYSTMLIVLSMSINLYTINVSSRL